MRAAGKVLVAACPVAILAAVWAPGAWWQWTVTAGVCLVVGGALQGSPEREAMRRMRARGAGERAEMDRAERLAEMRRETGREAGR